MGKLGGGDGIMSQNEDCLFNESINNNQNRCITGEIGEMLNEIHRYGIPWLLQDQTLFEVSVGSMMRGFSSVTTCAGLTEILYKFSESGPSILSSDQSDSLVLTEVSSSQMIVFVLEDSESEVFGVGYIDLIIFLEEGHQFLKTIGDHISQS